MINLDMNSSTMIFSLAILFAVSFIASLLLIPLCRRLAIRYDIMDYPGGRKIHQQPVPYLGGIAIFGGFSVGLLVLAVWGQGIPIKTALTIAVAATLIFLLGLYDDFKGTRARYKFGIQILVAALIVFNGFVLNKFRVPFIDVVIDFGLFSYAISIFWIVSISNAINLIDGLDGLAGGVSAISLFFMMVFAYYSHNMALAGLIISLLGGSLGFLVFNFPPAKIFMGDTGSLLIGFLFSVFCLMPETKHGSYTIAIVIPTMLLTIPILDTLLAIIRRAKNKQNIFSADKKHIHHRILQLSHSYRKTLLIIYAINVFIGLIATGAFFLPGDYRFVLYLLLVQNIIFGLYLLRVMESKQVWKEKYLELKELKDKEL